jgi:hypothetical protein
MRTKRKKKKKKRNKLAIIKQTNSPYRPKNSTEREKGNSP